MRRATRAGRAGEAVGAALAALSLLAIGLAVPAAATPPASTSRHARADKAADRTSPLAVSLVRTSPWTPATTTTPRPLTITVALRNTTDAPVTHIVLRGYRGATVTTQQPLTAKPASTLPSTLYPIASRPVRTRTTGKTKAKAKAQTIDVAVGTTVTATFRTTTGIPVSSGLCLCTNGVYPVYIAAYDSRSNALEGFTQTYLASVDKQPDGKGNKYRKVGVAWLWPLIDRPHRLDDGRVFTDDALAGEITPGRRLDRALQVVEDVGDVPITVMIDPELVDELAVMASGNYTYLSSSGRTVPGKDSATANAAARQWLGRLRAVLSDPDGNVSVEFTPYADPAVRSLTASGLTWQSQLPPTMLHRVDHALGLRTVPTSLSWPPGGVDQTTLNRITSYGSTDVVLNASNVSPSSTDRVPSSLVSLHTSHGEVGAALLSSALQGQVADTIDNAHPDLSHLPDVLAQVAVRADGNTYRHQVALLSVPRYVDANPAAAERVIRETTTSAFSTPVSLDTVFGSTATAALEAARVRPPSSAPNLPVPITTAAESVSADIPAVRSLLIGTSPTAAAQVLVTGLPRGLQRTESAGWLPGSTVGSRSAAIALSTRLRRQVTGLLGGVRIVRPPDGHYSYTLASTHSPLPITVDNSLPYRAFVHIDVRSVAGLPGLTTTDLGVQPIAPQSKQTFRVPAHVTRSGRIQLFATLDTANGHVLGPRVLLSVHSTVFGTVGVVITVVAAVILFIALAVRYLRRFTRRRRQRQPVTGPPAVTTSAGRVP